MTSPVPISRYGAFGPSEGVCAELESPFSPGVLDHSGGVVSSQRTGCTCWAEQLHAYYEGTSSYVLNPEHDAVIHHEFDDVFVPWLIVVALDLKPNRKPVSVGILPRVC